MADRDRWMVVPRKAATSDKSPGFEDHLPDPVNKVLRSIPKNYPINDFFVDSRKTTTH
jgi:hypothetical protein